MIAQAVNMMNFLKGPKQFILPIYQRTYSNPCFNSLEFERFKSQSGLNRFTLSPKKWIDPPCITKEMIDSDAIMDAFVLPDFCTSAQFYTQSFERNVDNGG